MQVSVEMTDEEFAEFLGFRKAKKTDDSAKKSLRCRLDNLSSLILQAVAYDASDPSYEVEDSEALVDAVDLAVSWLA